VAALGLHCATAVDAVARAGVDRANPTPEPPRPRTTGAPARVAGAEGRAVGASPGARPQLSVDVVDAVAVAALRLLPQRAVRHRFRPQIQSPGRYVLVSMPTF